MTEAPKTLRDEFAMAALTGLLSDLASDERSVGDLAATAFIFADAMMAERAKSPSPALNEGRDRG